jgi:hemerythrin superfamily protein
MWLNQKAAAGELASPTRRSDFSPHPNGRESEISPHAQGDSAMPSTDETTVVSFLHQQHEALKTMMRDIRTAEPTARPDLFAEFKRYLAAHEAFEIEVIHPAVKRLRPNGKSDVDQSLMEERSASNEIARLETLDATTEDFERSFAAFQQAVVDHAEHEEHDEFPLLAKAEEGEEFRLSAAELDRVLQSHRAADRLDNGHAHDRAFKHILDGARSGYVHVGDYEDMTKQQLYERAKTVGIEGRSRMSKPELISALRNH